ncbi:MAG: hypothetical protein ACOY45_16140 [Pseudomonadota bacterium]
MKPASHDTAQAMQRVRVGMTGLALVIVLIGLASAIFTSANRDEPVAAVGGSKADVVANMTAEDEGNTVAAKSDEPLAELGAAPSTTTDGVSAAEIARRIEAQRQAEAAQRAARPQAQQQQQ